MSRSSSRVNYEKVIPALEHCLKNDGSGNCVGCPFDYECEKDPDFVLRASLETIKQKRGEFESIRRETIKELTDWIMNNILPEYLDKHDKKFGAIGYAIAKKGKEMVGED